MPDWEKAIKGLKCCIEWDSCKDCPYETPNEYDIAECTLSLHKDALSMLKEQGEATVISIHRNGFGSRVGACPNCQSVLHYEYNQSFCGKCGQAVKWE